MNALENPVGSGPVPVQFGRCELRPWTRELRVDGKLATLGSRTFDLLLLLAGSAGELVTKERILTQVWGDSSPSQNRTLDVHVGNVRTKLGRPWLLETVR